MAIATVKQSLSTDVDPRPIQTKIQPQIAAIAAEINDENFERADIVRSMLVALISQQHVLMVGPGGTGKSKIVRDAVTRILGANYFEVALDETSTPDQVLGPPDIKAMVEEGKTRRVPDGMLPSAHIAFLDEVFNSNGPTLHALMPLLNERIFHNNGKPVPTPLLAAFAGTNKLNADADMAALWDRWHIRHQIEYIKDRQNLSDLLKAAMKRQVSTYERPAFTTISIDDLREAHDEAMQLHMPEVALDTFLNLVETLFRQGVIISTRRQVEGLKAVHANAWLAGHSEVRVGDLDILQHMFWTNQEQVGVVKAAILTACNPGEKRAMELLEELDKLVEEYKKSESLDPTKRNSVAVDHFKKVSLIMDKAEPLRDKAVEAGASTIRIDELIKSAVTLKTRIGVEVFNLNEEQVQAIKNGRR